jgi:hypothetical protein
MTADSRALNCRGTEGSHDVSCGADLALKAFVGMNGVRHVVVFVGTFSLAVAS